ncbi:hypothetical protein HYH02_001277 [Chlamydomonas schloesseri]|uniref:DNA2/NAM7 helicase-like C-terminal domain-containing protein n=1 Tax=Chlamydomonas schloesseri TaxID=2026947 RepID=A0A835WU24_9CHLO|nr:hypothetical protein HYH02_001277 [Chlamydomonas schloesseri]|eukprot:KAG2454243.1 hypothetical protein HYH02_001277 [Chlamydomonas schloesseri]
MGNAPSSDGAGAPSREPPTTTSVVSPTTAAPPGAREAAVHATAQHALTSDGQTAAPQLKSASAATTTQLAAAVADAGAAPRTPRVSHNGAAGSAMNRLGHNDELSLRQQQPRQAAPPPPPPQPSDFIIRSATAMPSSTAAAPSRPAAATAAPTAAAPPPQPPPAHQLPQPSPGMLRPSPSMASCASTASLSSVATSITLPTSRSGTASSGGSALSRASSAATAASLSPSRSAESLGSQHSALQLQQKTNTSAAAAASGVSQIQPKQLEQPKQKGLGASASAAAPTAGRSSAPPEPANPVSTRAVGGAGSATTTTGSSRSSSKSAVTPDLVIPLSPAVMGISALHVVTVRAEDLAPKHTGWLAAGWSRVPKPEAAAALAAALGPKAAAPAATGAAVGAAAASGSGGLAGKRSSAKGGKGSSKAGAAAAAAAKHAPLVPPKVLGFDTEFLGDQLAVVQLCAGPHVLLVQVPSSRQLAKEQSRAQQQPQAAAGKQAGKGGAVGSPQQWKAPFTLNASLKALLCTQTLQKAAAEVWQDALMVYMGFGVKMRGGLDLTVAVPPNEADKKRGRDKLGLFEIFHTFYPDAQHVAKDKKIDHSKWLASRLDEQQKRYAALNAFVSYAAGVCVLLRPGKAPPLPVDLAVPPEWEVRLAAQWVAVTQFLEAQSPLRTRHDFHSAVFKMFAKTGVAMEVRMARFNTRLRQQCWVEAALPDGRRINGRCNMARGKSATVIKLRWSDTKRDINSLAELPAQVTSIEMTDSSDTPEEAGIKRLLPMVLCGENRMRGRPLLEGVFGGGDFCFNAASAPGAATDADTSSSSSSSRQAAAAAGGKKKSKAQASVTSGSSSGALLPVGKPAGAAAVAHAEGAVRRLQINVNASQARALSEILRGACRTGQPGSREGPAVQLVQGPPGSGKTTVISHAVQVWLEQAAPRLPRLHKAGGAGSGARLMPAVACVARSNVAAKNIALALIKRGLGAKNFRLIVSQEFHYEWHEEQYWGALQSVLVLSSDLKGADMQRALLDVQVYVTTVSMLANPNFKATALHDKALSWLAVDEASQIYAADLMLPLYEYGHHLTCLSLFGDDMQLPPYGTEWDGAQIPSIFDQLSSSGGGGSSALTRLREQPGAFSVGPPLCPPAADARAVTATSAAAGSGSSPAAAAAAPASPPVVRLMLEVSYRLPRDLCAFISRHMYGGQLKSGRPAGGAGAAAGAVPAHVLWIDVVGQEERKGGRSCSNPVEARRVVNVAERLGGTSSWTILTGYDLQRSVLEEEVLRRGLGRHQQKQQATGAGTSGSSTSSGKGSQGGDRVYNIDTFQGREDEVVVVSLTRVKALGFMEDDRRVNVMLTRCTQQLVVVGSLRLALQHPHTLIGRMAAHCWDHGLVEQQELASGS